MKGFSQLWKELPELRGTYAGLGSTRAIEYLKKLVITAVELPPVHQIRERGGFTIAEDERNWAGLITAENSGTGLDAAWGDDFHHVVKVALTNERFAHFRSYAGTPRELLEIVQNSWLFRGPMYPQWQRPRRTPCAHLRPEQFIFCISNHDQFGNRPLGERLNHLVSEESYAAASALLRLLPYTPMLFTGQEWAASTSFCFFTDHAGELGKNVSKGRLKEFQGYKADFGADILAKMPDPQKESTFLDSKLLWNDLQQKPHQRILETCRAFLTARREHLDASVRSRENWSVDLIDGAILSLRYKTSHGILLILSDLKGGHTAPWQGVWRKILSSQDALGGGAPLSDN
jgi:maltooligosyltrehalose trehalohydrolase